MVPPLNWMRRSTPIDTPHGDIRGAFVIYGPYRGPTNFIIQRKSNILHLKPLKIIDL